MDGLRMLYSVDEFLLQLLKISDGLGSRHFLVLLVLVPREEGVFELLPSLKLGSCTVLFCLNLLSINRVPFLPLVV
jgi:hypothetical protein